MHEIPTKVYPKTVCENVIQHVSKYMYDFVSEDEGISNSDDETSQGGFIDAIDNVNNKEEENQEIGKSVSEEISYGESAKNNEEEDT